MSTAEPPRRAPDQTRLGGRVLVAVMAAALTGVTLTPVSAPAQSVGETAVASDVTLIHANILARLSVEEFQSDVREVLSSRPDVVTYNEVPLRQDSVIAPDGYDLQRSMKNRYTAATAVAWRSDRWSEVDSGTFRISNYREIPSGRSIRLGLRYANWVTLHSDEGRQMSVVAAHVPPLVKDMPDLLRPSVRRIGELVARLAPSGPVMVGGDFNVHYTSSRYPGDLLEAAKMVPTYDTLGTYFPTGDHRGATIDYIFNRGEGALTVDQQSKFELNSDHDAVVAGLSWQVDAPTDTQYLVSDPQGDPAAQHLVENALGQVLGATEPGSQVDVVTSGFGPHRLFRRLRSAVDRGVQVRLTTRSESLSDRERNLARFMRESGLPGSEVRRCRHDCATAWLDSGMARGFLLLHDGHGRAMKRMDVNRYLNPAMTERRTKLVIRTGERGLARGEKLLAAIS